MNLTDIRDNKNYAYVAPMVMFMVLDMLMQIACESGMEWAHPNAPWWREWPEQWMFPLQTVIVGGVLCFFWKTYNFRPTKGVLLGAVLGVIGIALWIFPSYLYDALGYTEHSVGNLKYFGLAPRDEGFDPSVLLPEFGIAGYWCSTILRFIRAAVVVALFEELFWRGFLMRFLVKPDGNYWGVPFGKPQRLSYLVTTGAFMLIHQPADYLGAFVFGSLMYWLAVRTKSLAACVVMHSVANILMGVYALEYSEFGLW
ncbi:MAG: CAAX prenyl protease-related protein [Rubritalea sp.]|uniref:CAAX prenyl protease-related protein n=1 Tax=Rubritalea sp. TaxID=2109375 RepID=UPI0032422FB5